MGIENIVSIDFLSTPKESSNAYTFVFGIFLKTKILNSKIFLNSLEQCFPVIHAYF